MSGVGVGSGEAIEVTEFFCVLVIGVGLSVPEASQTINVDHHVVGAMDNMKVITQ